MPSLKQWAREKGAYVRHWENEAKKAETKAGSTENRGKIISKKEGKMISSIKCSWEVK